MDGNNLIKSVQMGYITFITMTGVGVIMLPSQISEGAGHDGWISIILLCLLVLPSSLMILALLKRYSDKSVYDISKYIFGKVIGTAINILLLLYLMLTTVAGAGIFNYFMRITLLQETPAWALGPFIMLPSFYLVWQGLKHISRFLYISVYGYMAIIVIFIVLLKQFRVSFLLPVADAGWNNIAFNMKNGFFAFLGFELVGFFYPYITDKNKVLRSQMSAILIATAFFLFIVIISVGVLGENFLSVLMLPFFNISRVYNAPIFERIDLYLTALWFIPTACSMRSYVFAAFDGLNKVFGLKKTKPLYIVFFVSILILGSLPNSINQLYEITNIISIAGAAIILFFILCFFLSFIRKKGICEK